MARGPKFKFPTPESLPRTDQVTFCTEERIKDLYNQAHPDEPAKRVAKKVRTWFTQEANEAGWSGIAFLKDPQTRHSAGCAMGILPEPSKQQLIIITGNPIDED